MNLLILSSGTRNKIVQYFKKELQGKGKVYTTDASNLAPSLYDSDEHFIVPRIDHPQYLETILTICKENNVDGVLSLIDPELSMLSENKKKFWEIGTTPIVSNHELIELCFDKYQFNEFLKENNFNSIKSYIEKEKFYEDLSKKEINFPVFVKPVKGSASININKVTTKEEVEVLFDQFDNLMIQEFIDGTEIGADVYIDMLTNEVTSIFTKEKILMRAGETDKSKSIKNEKLFNLIKKFVNIAGFKGIIDIDIFEVDGTYYISEVNPRFGGGYPHAYEVGLNIPKQIINNLMGNKNKVDIGNYPENIFMLKYNELKIISESEMK
ncbi:ATP-grasp domain-containing protein [Carnobacteriaceae bacterium 52-44]